MWRWASLFCVVVSAVFNPTVIDQWLSSKIGDFNKAYLEIYHNGNMIYSKSESAPPKHPLLGKLLSAKTANSAYTGSSVIPIASCSKWLSAALVMTFVDEGKLKLTDKASQYLPELTGEKRKITLAQCLSHTTAIKAEKLRDDSAMIREAKTMDEAVQKIAALPMEGIPGKVFHYSSVGLQLAGAIVEKITGKSFEANFQERIAQPLGMLATTFGNQAVVLPAGGAHSSADDYMKFLLMIWRNGTSAGRRILSKRSIKLMQGNRIEPDVRITYTPDHSMNMGYGLGEWVNKTATIQQGGNLVSSPGLFGSYPAVNYQYSYTVALWTYNLHSKGRQEGYTDLINLLDQAFSS